MPDSSPSWPPAASAAFASERLPVDPREEASDSTRLAKGSSLGDVLLQAGFIDTSVLDLLQSQARTSHKRLTDIAIEDGFITRTQLNLVLSHHLGLPWISPSNVDVPSHVLDLVPRDLARRLKVLPVYVSRSDGAETLYVATDDPTNERIVTECEKATGLAIRLLVTAPNELEHALETHLSRSAPPEPAPPKAIGSVLHAVSVRPPRCPAPTPRRGRKAVTDAGELGWDKLRIPDGPTRDPGDVVLLVHAAKPLEDRCTAIARRLGSRLITADLPDVGAVAARERPTILIVPEDVYAFDRVAFNELATRIRAHLVLWSNDVDSDYLEPLIAASGGRRPGRDRPTPPNDAQERTAEPFRRPTPLEVPRSSAGRYRVPRTDDEIAVVKPPKVRLRRK